MEIVRTTILKNVTKKRVVCVNIKQFRRQRREEEVIRNVLGKGPRLERKSDIENSWKLIAY